MIDTHATYLSQVDSIVISDRGGQLDKKRVYAALLQVTRKIGGIRVRETICFFPCGL